MRMRNGRGPKENRPSDRGRSGVCVRSRLGHQVGDKRIQATFTSRRRSAAGAKRCAHGPGPAATGFRRVRRARQTGIGSWGDPRRSGRCPDVQARSRTARPYRRPRRRAAGPRPGPPARRPGPRGRRFDQGFRQVVPPAKDSRAARRRSLPRHTGAAGETRSPRCTGRAKWLMASSGRPSPRARSPRAAVPSWRGRSRRLPPKGSSTRPGGPQPWPNTWSLRRRHDWRVWHGAWIP
ncbi:hypothetical protein FBY22_1592 [Streptomyces sp. SLBN-31]|nr:hypothetical protein FBY22_1592 [Streptomyces sp. SLBN-31]